MNKGKLTKAINLMPKELGPLPLGALEIGGCLRLCGIWMVKVPRNRGDR